MCVFSRDPSDIVIFSGDLQIAKSTSNFIIKLYNGG